MQKILSRYELFKLTLEVPGDIAECGVFKGSGLYTWVKLMRLFKPNNEYRVHGFDFFETDRTAIFQYQADQDVLDEHQEGWTTQENLLDTCSNWGFNHLKLHAGNVVETTKRFKETELGARLSLLYIDVDNYEGALACLENLYPSCHRRGKRRKRPGRVTKAPSRHLSIPSAVHFLTLITIPPFGLLQFSMRR